MTARLLKTAGASSPAGAGPLSQLAALRVQLLTLVALRMAAGSEGLVLGRYLGTGPALVTRMVPLRTRML